MSWPPLQGLEQQSVGPSATGRPRTECWLAVVLALVAVFFLLPRWIERYDSCGLQSAFQQGPKAR